MTIFNLGYATGVARKRSESNMLRSAVRTLLRMHRTGATSKLPADMGAMVVGGWGERQGDLATLAKKLRDALGGKWVTSSRGSTRHEGGRQGAQGADGWLTRGARCSLSLSLGVDLVSGPVQPAVRVQRVPGRGRDHRARADAGRRARHGRE